MVGTLIHSIPLYVGIPISYQTNYEEYKQLLTSALEKQSEEIVFRKQLKNNNVYLDAVCLKNKSVSPVVYFESYFENFKSGTSIEEIANQILDVLHSSPTDIIEKFFNLS